MTLAAAPPVSPSHAVSAADPPVRVLICDDSAVIRTALARMLDADPRISVVGRVGDGRQAVEAVARERPDVVVLDIEMPVLDGLGALPLILRADPSVRVVMASTLTARGADVALRALRLGAADYLHKPSAAAIGAATFRDELIAKVAGLGRLRRRAATPFARKGPGSAAPGPVPPSPVPPGTIRPAADLPGHAPPGASPPAGAAAGSAATMPLRPLPLRRARLLAIGSSTGGPQALFTLALGLGRDLAVPIVLTQHMPPAFTAILAEHITRVGGAPCAEARDGEILRPGAIHQAPGDRHLLIHHDAGGFRARLSQDAPENYCRPAVDPMLRTAARAADGQILVVMLTGMGHDGLEGTRRVIDGGGAALAQDEATSVVWGMPGAIARAGLCHAVLPLDQLAPRVRQILRGGVA